MEKIDVLWFIEHIAREMDTACAVKSILSEQYGIDITIRNMYLHAADVLREFNPRVVVHPFFYFAKGALATEDFITAWPHSIHFNLAWEEIHYKAHQKVKAPSDNFAKKEVIHHAWGNFYRDYLVEFGVPADHIFVNGQPAFQLYKPPYNQYYQDRMTLARKYHLNPSRRWIFIPENYRWAFIGNKIKFFSKLGGDTEEMLKMKDFSIESLNILMQWCNDTAKKGDCEIIFRPRPSTNSQLMWDFFREHVGTPSPFFHLIKEETVREWILASDVVISSYSTSLIEAAICGKPAYMVEPIAIPDSLFYDWYQYTPHLYTQKDFESACLNSDVKETGPLKHWAENELLANGDPIEKLAAFVSGLVKQAKDKGKPNKIKFTVNPKKKYFNEVTHEQDSFTEEDIRHRVTLWKKILANRNGTNNQNHMELTMLIKKKSTLTDQVPTSVEDQRPVTLLPDKSVDSKYTKDLFHRINKVRNWITETIEKKRPFTKHGEFNLTYGLKYRQLGVLKEMSEALETNNYVCPKFPDFIMIGCTRGASTWVQKTLSKNSGIIMPKYEPTFFSKFFKEDAKYLVERLQPIEPFFDMKDKENIDLTNVIRGEKNPDYLGLPIDQIHFMRKLMPRLKVILSVRDPIDACWSNLRLQFGRAGKDIMQTDEEEVLNRFSKWRNLWPYQSGISKWRRFFGDFLIVFFDDIAADPEGQLTKILEYLGAKKEDMHPDTDFSSRVNEAPQKCSIPPNYFSFLREFFRDEYEGWETLFGRPAKYK
ncbi:MAG: sulfotransferase [Candidatus Omnitrophota bacterium]